jgi:hypothetical protein
LQNEFVKIHSFLLSIRSAESEMNDHLKSVLQQAVLQKLEDDHDAALELQSTSPDVEALKADLFKVLLKIISRYIIKSILRLKGSKVC